MSRYTKKEREAAFLAYVETGTISATSKITGVGTNALYKWKEDYNWEERKEDYYSNLPSIIEQEERDLALEELCKRYNIDPDTGSTLKDLNTVIGICMGAIKGNEKVKETFDLYPVDFDSAMKALKICWDQKRSLLKRDNNDNSSKPDVIGIVQNNYYGRDNERTEIYDTEVVPRGERDFEPKKEMARGLEYSPSVKDSREPFPI